MPSDSERKLNKKPFEVVVVVVVGSEVVMTSALLTRREGASSLERLESSSLSQAETMAAIVKTLKKIRHSLRIFIYYVVTVK